MGEWIRWVLDKLLEWIWSLLKEPLFWPIAIGGYSYHEIVIDTTIEGSVKVEHLDSLRVEFNRHLALEIDTLKSELSKQRNKQDSLATAERKILKTKIDSLNECIDKHFEVVNRKLNR